MNNENEEFNERFETIEQALKYIADSQAKAEFLDKKYQIESRKRQDAWDKKIEEMQSLNQNTQKHLNHITKIVSHLVDVNEDEKQKVSEIVEILSK